jgi:molybdenum cofactor cytidylyltransferase
VISAILLAAGQSKRMDGENKLAKEIQGVPLIKHSVKNILASSVDELIIVLGYQKEIIEKLIDKNEKIKLVFNKNFESGMASSIKIGLDNLSEETEIFFICLGDMPNVDKEIYNQLINLSFSNKDKEIFVPYYQEKQANPILFSKKMKSKIEQIEGDFGAKKIIAEHEKKVFKLSIQNKGVITDFNNIIDFESK